MRVGRNILGTCKSLREWVFRDCFKVAEEADLKGEGKR